MHGNMKLTMRHYLSALEQHGISTAGLLVEQGFHPKVVMAKAEKAARRGYSEYGTSPWCSWILDEGREFLVAESATV